MKNIELEKSVMDNYKLICEEEQKKGIIRNRYQYGEELIRKTVHYAIRGLITKKHYHEMMKIIEDNFIF